MPVDEKNQQDDGSAPDAAASAAAGKKRVPGLAREIQAQIGRKLMAAYDDVLQQPVPDRFLLLLEELDRKPGDSQGEVGKAE